MMNIKTSVVAITCAISAGVVYADGLKQLTKEELLQLTPQQRREYVVAVGAQKSGGMVVKPNSERGVAKIVYAVPEFNTAKIEEVLREYKFFTHLDVKVEKGISVTPETAFKSKGTVGAQAVVYIIDDANLPRVLVAPEEGWAIVNAGAMKADKPDDEKLSMRLTKEALRGLAFVGGMGQTSAYVELLGPVRDVRALDRIDKLELSGDAVRTIPQGLAAFDVVPPTIKVYSKACEEGWAPLPTNDVQKSIWNKYHSLPTRPMVIEPEVQ